MMRTSKSTLWAGGLILLLAAVSPALAKDDEQRVEQSLVRPADGDNPRIKGDLEMRVEPDRERFVVKVRRAEEFVAHDLFLADRGGVMRRVGSFRTDGSYLRYRDRVRDGEGDLPLGVRTLGELAGRRLEVRAGSEVVLYARVAGFGSDEKAKDREDLASTPSAPRDAEAQIRLLSRPSKGKERFEVKVKDFDLGRGEELRLWMEDPARTGVLVDLGRLKEDTSDSSEHRFRRRTRQGQELPFGVSTVRALGDLRVEVRDQADTVYFEGEVPELD